MYMCITWWNINVHVYNMWHTRGAELLLTRAVLRLVWPLISSLVMSMMFSGGLVVCPDLRRRSSILLQSARDRVATAAETVTE